MMNRPLRYGVLALAQIAVGAAAIFARFALTGAGALAVSAARLSIAAVVLLTIAGVRHVTPRHRRRDTFRFALAGLALATHFGTWIWSLQLTTVAISTLLVATTPVWTALYDAIVHRRLLSLRAWLAMTGGGIGVALVAGIAPPHTQSPLAGALLAICGAMAIGAYFLIVRGASDRFDTRAIVTQTYTFAAIALIVAAAIARQGPPALSDARAWGGIVAMALVSQLVGHTAMNAALKWFSAHAVAFSTLLEPVVAAVLALLIFGETLSVPTLFGAVLVLVALVIFLREERGVEGV